MAVSIARIWALFKLVRVLVFSLSTILSMGFTAIYAVLLLRGWKLYTAEQRVVVIILLAIYAVSSIILYLMLIFRFRLWLDGIRVAFLLFFQVGGTVAVALLNPSFPCNNLGSVSICKTIEDISIFGGWSLIGILLLFAFYLAAMSYVPVPKPRPNPEAALAINLGPSFLPSFLGKDFMPEKREKRASLGSLGSASSVYSQDSSIGSLRPAAPRIPTGAIRSSSASGPRMPLNYYRPGTPGSVRSMAPSSVSTIRASTRQRYYNSQRIPAPQPRVAQQSQLPIMANPQALSETVSRQGTPMSIMSQQPPYTSRQRQPPYLTPPGLGYVGPGLNFPQPPGYVPSSIIPPRVTSPLAANKPIIPASGATYDPPSMAMQMQDALTIGTPSPVRSLHSEGGIREVPPSPSGSVSSVPRSPSPQYELFHNLPTTPLSAVLPAHPVLPPSPSPYRGMYEGYQMRRYGSSLNINLNDQPQPSPEHYRSGSDYHDVPPSNWANWDTHRMGAVDYRRQNTVQPPNIGR